MSDRNQQIKRQRFTVAVVSLIIGIIIGASVTLIIVHATAKNKIPETTDIPKPVPSSAEENNQKEENKEDESTTASMDIEFDVDSSYTNKYCVGVNRSKNVVTVYTGDKDGRFTVPVKAMLCSCGKPNGNDTPAGTFKTTDRVRWLSLVNDTYGQYTIRINSHIWFHSVPYFTKDPSKLEYEEYNKLGNNASLGCVRLNVEDAKWLYENLDFNTLVKVYDSENPGPLGKPKAITIDTNSANKGWDPTDPDPLNPWNN